MPTTKTPAILWVYDDGGRARAGFHGKNVGDCAARAAAIASGRPYREVYDRINELARKHERRGSRKKGISDARDGVYKQTFRRLMDELGATWHPTMAIGSGCTVHVMQHELPLGRLVLNLSKHYSACIDGVLYDTHDPSRDGSRCCYGYWVFPEDDEDGE